MVPYAFIVCDGLGTVAGLPKSQLKLAQAELRHRSYIDRLHECRQSVAPRAAQLLSAVATATAKAKAFQQELVQHGLRFSLRVLAEDMPTPAEAKQHEVQSKWFVDLRVNGEPLLPQGSGALGQPDIVNWWVALRAEQDASDVTGVCQVTGERGRLARLFPASKLPGNSPRLVRAARTSTLLSATAPTSPRVPR